MHRNTASIIVTLWSLILLPVLCVGGVIGHACECDAEADSNARASSAHNSDCRHEADCHHESDCGDDPCTQLAAAARQRGEASMPAVFHSILNMNIVAFAGDSGVGFVRPGVSPPTVECPRRPFPPADMPLLV